ncbi:MAG: beta-glucuronidase [Clostridium sp.]|nr:beta-glucuronidase [Clostridium sp.]
MLNYSELYPRSNEKRLRISLDGLWKFQFDPEEAGEKENWKDGLLNPIKMPVPASFADFFTDAKSRDYCGDFWYETEFFLPDEAEEKEYFLRFGSLTHRAEVYCNGQKVGAHEGGFLPVVAPVTGVAKKGEPNRLVIKLNNEVNEESIPCGAVHVLKDGRKLAKPYFDFYNYSGIHRSVYLVSLPKEAIQDYSVNYELKGKDALVHYQVKTNGTHPVKVELKDEDGVLVAQAEGAQGTLEVKDAHLWKVRNAYLYSIIITISDGEKLIDKYSEKIGIRTVKVEGTRILLNGEQIYLKGYGKHEDFEVIGRGFNWGVVKRDFECMKWSNANSFRTSHYPYAEEWYQMADEEGFLIIDEVPGVGMMRSMANFAAAGSGKYTYFFEAPTVPTLKKAHLQALEEMIARDKNHPCVIAWSLFNEPETISSFARDYFKDIFDRARALDIQSRPLTGALEKTSSPEKCQCCDLCDFVCLNRYYGWYISGGPEIVDAREGFIEEMDAWEKRGLNVPFVFTEFGADTMSTEHKLPGVMWTQEYQNEYMELCFEIFDKYDFIQGELVWNFADFQASEGIMRVNGNKKGIFTRNRQPKDVAYRLKERWSKI